MKNKMIKNTLALALTIGSITTAFAGTPDEDSVTANRMARFIIAEPVTSTTLQLGKQWLCRESSALRGATETPGYRVGFTRFDGVFRDNLGNAEDMDNDYLIRGNDLNTKIRHSDGSIEYRNYRYEPKTGSLLCEISLTNSSGVGYTDWKKLELTPYGVAASDAKVHYYGVCERTDYTGKKAPSGNYASVEISTGGSAPAGYRKVLSITARASSR